MNSKKTFPLLFFFVTSLITAQELDIVPYLKQIESGNAASVEKIIHKLKSENPGDPSVLFLDAVLTSNGSSALDKYANIYDNYPESRFADAALYRIFSYYYSMGYYSSAEEYLNKLKREYPSSPYINAADRSIPDTEEIAPQITPTQEPKTEPASLAKFTIQAGAFLNTQNAINLKSKLEAEGYYSNINPKEVGGSILNVVTVGKFATESEADPLLNHLKSNYNLNGRVVPFK